MKKNRILKRKITRNKVVFTEWSGEMFFFVDVGVNKTVPGAINFEILVFSLLSSGPILGKFRLCSPSWTLSQELSSESSNPAKSLRRRVELLLSSMWKLVCGLTRKIVTFRLLHMHDYFQCYSYLRTRAIWLDKNSFRLLRLILFISEKLCNHSLQVIGKFRRKSKLCLTPLVA